MNTNTLENQNKSDDNKMTDISSSQKPSHLVEKKSGNISVDNFIKKTRKNKSYNDKCIKWFDYEKFVNLKQIGEGGFAKVYSATWLDGGKKFIYTDPVNKMKKIRTYPDTVALKSIKGSNEISTEYLSELQIYHQLSLENVSLPFFGITKDPKSSEFMMVTTLARQSLRSLLAEKFTKMGWRYKLSVLSYVISELKILHDQGICHKDLHSGNILNSHDRFYLTDFGLAGPSDRSSEKIYGVLGYIAPEVLKGKPYCSHADIYSFGIMMAELSSGFPPFFNKNMREPALAISICNGLKPDFGKGTPEIYKNLAYKCMNINPDERPTASELKKILSYWHKCSNEDISDDAAKKIKAEFELANEEIPNVQSLFKKNTQNDFKYVSKQLDFSSMIKNSASHGLDSSILDLKLSDDTIDDINEDNDGNDESLIL